MEPQVGSILEGKVTSITKFGAFVALEGGRSGLVHISEIANTFVNDVHDFLQEGQTVKVLVLSTENGKINLSIKKTLPQQERPGFRPQRPASARPAGPRPGGFRNGQEGGRSGGRGAGRAPREGGRGPAREAAPRVWQPKAPARSDNLSFEDMMSRFKSQSEEKMADLDHETNNRRGGGYAPRSRRGR